MVDPQHVPARIGQALPDMPHKIKAARRHSCPSLVAAVCVDTVPAPPEQAADGSGRAFGAGALVVYRRADGEWYEVDRFGTTDPAALLDRVDEHAVGGRRLYVVAPGCAEALTLLGWWRRVKDGRYTVWRTRTARDKPVKGGKSGGRVRSHPLILSGLPDVIGYELPSPDWRGKRQRPAVVRWVGVRQFGEPTVPTDLVCEERAEWVSKWVRSLMSSWIRAGCGRWADTGGAAAWASWRTHLGPTDLVTHERDDARKLESRACHGGRAECWFYGSVSGDLDWPDAPGTPPEANEHARIYAPVWRVDVSAMYPTVMRDEYMPCRLVNVHHDWTIDHLWAALSTVCVVARVKIHSRRAELPAYHTGGSTYPRGSYWTCLATPDIADALAHDEIEQVGAVCVYERGRPFQLWADWILSLRRSAKLHPSEHWSRYVKAVSVALSGRLASTGAGWKDRPMIDPESEWGEWREVSLIDGVRRRYRSLGYHCQVYERSELRPGTLGACYAHITAHGRQAMRRYRAHAGHRQVLSQHTDGLIVTGEGLSRLRANGLIHPGQFGALRVEGSYTHLRMYGPNHLWADGRWVWAGLAAGWSVRQGTTVIEHHTHDPARHARSPLAGIVREWSRSIDLADVAPDVTPDALGWVRAPSEPSRRRRAHP